MGIIFLKRLIQVTLWGKKYKIMSKITRVAKELLQIDEDLPFRIDYTKNPKPDFDDFEIYIFEQTWGSTALGFPGIGGQAITSAFTYVLIPQSMDSKCFIYFAGRFAYAVPYCRTLIEDIKKQNVVPVYQSAKYKEDNTNETNQ